MDPPQLHSMERFHQRYEHDELLRLVLSAVQLRSCSEMLTNHHIADARMAMSLVDQLADSLLHRHVENLLDGRNASFLSRRPMFGRKARNQVLRSFQQKLRIACDPNE